MDVNENGQPADSYEERNDLAIRSAAGDPMAEPRSTPSDQTSELSHSRNSSIGRKEALQKQSSDPSEKRSPQAKHQKNSSFNELKAQLQGAETSNAIDAKDGGSKSKVAPTKDAMSSSLPDFIIRRNELFDKLKQKAHAEVLTKEKPEIDVVLDLGPDPQGRPRPAMSVAAKAWESTPGSFLRHVDKDISSDVVVAKVDGKTLWDLDRPLEYACRVSYLPFSSPEGRNVFWHSSAHVLGEAAECQFNCLLSHGPPVEQGFFYDMAIAEG